MCQPCCEATYVKYLDKDNAIKLTYLEKLGTNVSVTVRPDHGHRLTEWLLEQGKQPPVITEINIDGVVKPFCMCQCHREDLSVCH
jgi:hypothetical protein